MNTNNVKEAPPRFIGPVRWVARLWSTVVLAFMIVMVFYPDAGEPIAAVDWFLLALWGLAVLGLLVAWRWEAAGACVAIGGMCLREVAFFLIKGFWVPAFLLVWVLILPPAMLYLVAWVAEGRANFGKKSKNP